MISSYEVTQSYPSLAESEVVFGVTRKRNIPFSPLTAPMTNPLSAEWVTDAVGLR